MGAAVTNEEALRLARAQLQIRYQQLLSCRICGADAKRFEEAIERIRQLEHQHRGEGAAMTFKFSKASLDRLATVDPQLRKVAHRALELSPVDFVVVQGGRTLDEQKRLYGKGRTAAQCKAKGVPVEYARPNEAKVTWTLNSSHIGGRAIDVAPYVDGGIQWDDSGKRGLWPKIAAAFKQASEELGIPITWGGDWTTTVDRPHFELKR